MPQEYHVMCMRSSAGTISARVNFSFNLAWRGEFSVMDLASDLPPRPFVRLALWRLEQGLVESAEKRLEDLKQGTELLKKSTQQSFQVLERLCLSACDVHLPSWLLAGAPGRFSGHSHVSTGK